MPKSPDSLKSSAEKASSTRSALPRGSVVGPFANQITRLEMQVFSSFDEFRQWSPMADRTLFSVVGNGIWMYREDIGAGIADDADSGGTTLKQDSVALTDPGRAVPADAISVTLPSGTEVLARRLIVGEGSAFVDGVVTVAGGGGGSSTGSGTSYTLFITTPAANSQNDVGDVTVGVRVLPAPANGTTVLLEVDQVIAGGVSTSGETGSTAISGLALGSHTVVAQLTSGGTVYRSAPVVFFVANQAPVVTIVSPTNEADATVGVLPVTLTVTHQTAPHTAFTVQCSLDPTFATGVAAATWQSGDTWTSALTLPSEANYYVHARAYDSTPGGTPSYATPHRVSSLPPEVMIETTGQTFAPQLNVATGAAISWVFSDSTTSASGTPSNDFGSAATRVQRVTVTPATAVRDLNFGFNEYDDPGRWYVPGPAYNRANQNVSRILGMGRLALGLRRFMAAHNPFIGLLDFTGFTYLEDIELFQSYCTSITLVGCTSLVRLCVEQISLTQLDISVVAANLVDLRAAVQRGGSLTLTMGVMLREAHWCVRGQALTIITPPGETVWTCLPVVEEIWCFNMQTQIAGGIMAPISPNITSIQAMEGRFHTINLAGRFPVGRNAYVWLTGNPIVALNIDSCPGLREILLDDCNMSTVLVDYVLTTMNAYGTTNCVIDLSGNMGPSAAGEAAALAIIARGGTVTREAVVGNGVNADTFDRADGAVGNGWISVLNSATATISSNALSRTDSGAYRLYGNPGVNLPANYRVWAEFPESAIATGFSGVFGRWVNGHGVKLLIGANRETLMLGDASGFGDGNVTIIVTGGLPASWYLNQVHSMCLEMNGNVCTVWLDNVVYGYGILSTNQTSTGTYYGYCGAGPWVSNRIEAVAV